MPVSFTLNRVTNFRPLTGDQDGDGYADAGDVLRHTLTIHNTGDTAATSVVLNDLLGGSTETGLMNISPIAFDDAFTAVGNTALRVGGAANIGSGPSSVVSGNLLNNDVGSTTVGVGALAGDDVTGFTIDTVTNALTAGGGRFSIFADGSFNYISEAGDQGTDSFTYTIRDAGIDGVAGNSDDTTSTATVNITLTGQVWYVDSAAAGGGTGTSANPFNSITALQSANVDGANDYVYVKGNATGQLVMETGEHLIGQGASLDVASFHLADAGSRSTVTNNAAGFGVTLAGGGTGNNEIAGINIVSTGGAGNHALTGTSFGTLTIGNTTIDASGQGLVLSTGAIAGTGLVSTDSDGGTNNVSLTGITGSLALGTGALSGATGTAFNVSGGSVTTTYSGNVSQATASQALLSVAGGHSGTLTFSTGTLSASNGTGLQFDNADGTYNLNGNNTLNGGDAGIDILNGSSGTFSFSSNSSIINPTGTSFNLSSSNANVTYSGAISDNTGKAVVIDNHDSGTITFQTGSITSTGTGLTVSNSNGGTINFNGQTTLTTTTSTAVDLATNNGGGTIVFNAAGNGLDITTTTGAGFLASGGGTLTVLGAGNTIVSGSGTAFNASGGTTIAVAGVTFASIGSNGSVNGIVLNGTGSTGFFTVTGDGSQTAGLFDRDGSGGTIQNTTQDAISLTNAFNVTLRQMNITNAGWDGVGSVGGGNILLRAMDINHPGNANPASDGSTGNTSGFGGGNGWYAQNITGVNSFDNNSRVFNWQSLQSNGVVVNSSNTNFTSFTVDNAFFSTSATGAAGVNVSMNGSSSGIATLTDTDLTLIDQNGAQFLNNGSGTLTAIVQRNNFHDADATAGDGNNTLYMSNSANGLLNFRIGGTTAADGNTFHNLARLTTLAGAVQVDAAGGSGATPAGGSINGFIQNNTIFNDAGFTNGRRAIDIQVEADSHNLGTIAVDISNNTVNNVSKQGISITVVSVGGGSVTNSNFTITNNSIGSTSPVGTEGNVDSGSAIEIETNFDTFSTGADIVLNTLIQGNTFVNNNSAGTVGSTFDITNRGGDAGTTSVMNMTMLGNTITNQNGAGHVVVIRSSGGGTGAGGTVNLDMNSANTSPNNTTLGVSAAGEIQLNQTVATAAFNIENLGANPVDAFVSARNSGDTVTHSGTIGSTGAVTMPTAPTNFIIATPPPPPAPPAETPKGTGDGTGGELPPPAPDPADPTPPPAPAGEQAVVVDDGILSQAELNLIVSAAIDRWAAAGATPEQIAAMHAVTVSVEDLAGLALGSSSAGHITIDRNAAGFSWFIDATPGDDSEYSGTGTRLTAAQGTQAGVRIDLLTTIAHELGHQIGLSDDFNAADRDELMYGTIDPGERRLPGNDDLTGASAAPLTGTAFALSPVSLGTIPAGRIVVVQWDSTVNAFTNQIVPTFTNHSILSGGNFVSVNSNDEVLSPTSAPIALDSVTLGNLIFLDANNNGTFDGADTGINGVTLTLFADTNANGVFDSGIDVQLATATTAGGGLYSFANLAPGDYIVRVDAANFTGGGALVDRLTATGGADPDDNVNNDDNGVAGAGGIIVSQAITLTQDGETTADGTGKLDINNTLDFGFIQLNQPPVNTVPGTQTINEDATLTFTGGTAISVNDPDVGAGNLTVTLSVVNGQLTLSGTAGLSFSGGSDGTDDTTMTFSGTQAAVNAALNGLLYETTLDYNGSDTLTIVTNDNGNTGADPGTSGGPNDEQDTDTVTINITAVADIVADTPTVGEDSGANNLDLLGNDNFENPGRSITSVTQGLHGFVSINDNNTVGNTTDDFVVYTPAGDYNGADTFTYTVTSGGVTETANVNVTVTAVADIADDTATVGEDSGATTIDVIANDSFENGGFSITGVTQGLHGTVTIIDGPDADANPDYVTYTPAADYNGSDTFTYTVTSGGVTETANVNVTVSAVADIADDSVGVAQDSGTNNLDLLANDTFESAGRAITAVGAALHGTTAIDTHGDADPTNDTVTYSPTAGYFGPDTFTYTVTSGGVTETATVSVNVAPANASPVIDLNGAGGGIDDTASYTENAGPVILASGVTVSDADDTNIESASVSVGAGFIANFDYLTVNGGTNGTITGINFNYVAATGILTLTGTATLADYQAVLAQVGFESTSNAPGASRAISWTVNDGTSDSAVATTTVSITEVNDEPTLTATGANPTFTEDGAAVDLFGTVTASTVEPGQTLTSMTLTVTNVTDGASEVLSFDGSNVALTNGNSVVTAGHTLTVNVSLSGTTATVSFSGAMLSEAALASLVDGLAYSNTSQNPTDADRVVTITQLVDSGANGAPDDNTATLSISSTVDVDPTNDAAIITGTTTGSVTEAGGVNNGTPGTPTATGDLDSTDVDNTNDAWQAVAAGAATTNGYGTYALDAAGVWIYTLDDNNATVQALNGAATLTDTFTALTEDGTSQLVTVTIHAQDDGPVARPDAVTTDEATVLSGSVFSNNGSGPDGDVDGPPLTVSAVNGSPAAVGMQITLPSGALLTLNADGTFSYDPNHIFDNTPAPGSGASNMPAGDHFDYTLTGGGTTTVSVTITGVDSNDLLLGTAGADTLVAGIGNDLLVGLGGADHMSGNTGNDTYIVDNAGDVVTELTGEGVRDVVYASVSYELAAGSEVEVLSTSDQSGTAPLALIGNGLGQEIYGNAGANFLEGGGGTDYLIGLGGNDSYVVDGTEDVVIEAVGGGTDIVYARGDYTLGATAEIEVLSTFSQDATTAATLVGNGFDQTIYGNAGANFLAGGGGTDVLVGLAGNDVYLVDGASDYVAEAVGGGRDVVYTQVSYALGSGQEVEVLSTVSQAAATAINLTGNELANELYGNAGVNVLNGGAGADYMLGLGGADTFQFTTALGNGNVDQIGDFLSGTDKIALDDAIFDQLAPLGPLSPTVFHVGTGATNEDQRIIYDDTTGNLYYDADGNGVGAAVLFATLNGHPIITASDFTVI